MKKNIGLFKELNVLAHEVKDNFTIEAYDNLINKIEEISMKGNFDNIVVENLFNLLQYLKENKSLMSVDYICSCLNAIIINNDFYIRRNSLFDRIKEIYEELYRVYLNVKEFNENDSYYLELVKLNNMLHDEVNSGMYDSLVKDYPNIKEVLLEDFYLEKRRYNYDGILFYMKKVIMKRKMVLLNLR